MILKQTIKRFVLETSLTPISYGGIFMDMNDYDKRLKTEEEEMESIARGIARIIAVSTLGAAILFLISGVF